ncbi:MAG TPA: hypothetical protein VJN89_20185 [Candidatus Acidoferrum sp.]|nr:hypothetical protein [Candidatus Acidoferrum sp.]
MTKLTMLNGPTAGGVKLPSEDLKAIAEKTAVPLNPERTETDGAATVPVAFSNAPSPLAKVNQGEGQPFHEPGAVPSRNSITKSVADKESEVPEQVPEQVRLVAFPVSKEAVDPAGGMTSANCTDKLPEFPGALMLKLVCPADPPIA